MIAYVIGAIVAGTFIVTRERRIRQGDLAIVPAGRIFIEEPARAGQLHMRGQTIYDWAGGRDSTGKVRKPTDGGLVKVAATSGNRIAILRGRPVIDASVARGTITIDGRDIPVQFDVADCRQFKRGDKFYTSYLPS